MLLVDKYKPKTLKEVYGQDYATSEFKKAVLNKNHVFLHGSNGNGKTSSVYALARDMGYEIFELNASDYRNKEEIKNILGSVIKQRSLFNTNKLILIDEVDGLSGSKDRGGLQEIPALLDESIYPIVLIANDPWNSKFNGIRKKCKLIEFKKLENLAIVNILKNICLKEGIKYGEIDLKILAAKVKGDLRAAINDLEILARDGQLSNVNLLEPRQTKEDILLLLKLILKGKNLALINEAMLNTDITLDELTLWLDENMPKEYSNDELEKAYHYLAKSDVFKGRIIKRQYWRFLTYQNTLMGCGVASSKKELSKKFVSYKRSERILSIWISNMRKSKRNAVISTFLPNLHMSNKKFVNELSYMKNIFMNKKVLESLDIKDEESKYLLT